MIHVFNYPVDQSSIDEFHGGRNEEGQEPIFDPKVKRRKDVKYRTDGRKEIDGEVQDKQDPNDLWRTTLNRGVANEWREKANGGRLQRARKYIASVSYDVKVYIAHHPTHNTVALVVINCLLLAVLLYIMKLI